MKLIVKIKPDIAKEGNGFTDIQNGIDIRPPFKNGKPVVDHAFTVESTPFIENKIANGELILINRLQEKEAPQGDNRGSQNPVKTTYKISINGNSIDEITVDAGVSNDEIFDMANNRPKIKKGLKGKEVTHLSLDPDKQEIVFEVK